MTAAPKPLGHFARLVLQPASRYPADPRAVFILVLAVLFGVLTIIVGDAPNALERELPGWAIFFWGAMLVGGSAVTLGGMLLDSLNGIITEQVGSVAVGAATLFYVFVVFVTNGWSASLPMSIVMGWGVACFVRWFQLQMLINSAYRESIAEKIKRKIQEGDA